MTIEEKLELTKLIGRTAGDKRRNPVLRCIAKELANKTEICALYLLAEADRTPIKRAEQFVRDKDFYYLYATEKLIDAGYYWRCAGESQKAVNAYKKALNVMAAHQDIWPRTYKAKISLYSTLVRRIEKNAMNPKQASITNQGVETPQLFSDEWFEKRYPDGKFHT